MSDALETLILTLKYRLPELEWKLSQLSQKINSRVLPRGLFQTRQKGYQGYVEEIKNDLNQLTHLNAEAFSYLSAKVAQKINVLVQICKLDEKKTKLNKKSFFDLEKLTTHHQWILNIEERILKLTSQKKSLEKSLSMLPRDNKTSLQIHCELGKIERQLTAAKEELGQEAVYPL